MHSRRTHEGKELAGLDDAIDIGEDSLGLLSLAVLDGDGDTFPAKTPDVGVGQLGVVATNHLLDVRHLVVASAITRRKFGQFGQVGKLRIRVGRGWTDGPGLRDEAKVDQKPGFPQIENGR